MIKRLRALYSKKDPSPELMDLNQATREVISLSLSDLQRWRVIVLQELADNLPLLMADRVQVQQVIMNLRTKRLRRDEQCRRSSERIIDQNRKRGRRSGAA